MADSSAFVTDAGQTTIGLNQPAMYVAQHVTSYKDYGFEERCVGTHFASSR